MSHRLPNGNIAPGHTKRYKLPNGEWFSIITNNCSSGISMGSEYTPDQIEFMKAIEKAQREHGKYLRFDEVLQVAKGLGYAK